MTEPACADIVALRGRERLTVPAIIADADGHAAKHFLEFFTARTVSASGRSCKMRAMQPGGRNRGVNCSL
jgi:hypothetical protein